MPDVPQPFNFLPSPAAVVPPQPLNLTPAPPPVTMRSPDDGDALRQQIYERVLQTTNEIEPMVGKTHTLRLRDVHYGDPDGATPEEKKRARLEGTTLGRRLRGTWELLDNITQQPVDSRKATLAVVPRLLDDGTFIYNGSIFTLANQMRLRSGSFARRQENGELETHINVKPGHGYSHHLGLDPATGVMRVTFGQANIPLISLLKALGVSDRQFHDSLAEEVGHDKARQLVATNIQADRGTGLGRLHEKLGRKTGETTDDDGRRTSIADAIRAMQVDPEVMQSTLGQSFDKLDAPVYLAAAKKLLAISHGKAEPDDRDALSFQQAMGPEDLISERMSGQRHGIKNTMRMLLWKSANRKSLKHIPSGVFSAALQSAILESGLGSPTEGINPLMLLDQRFRISRMGQGGIPSADSVPDDARNVHPSQFGFIDPVVTPESSSAGVDLRLAQHVKKGSDGRLYAPFKNTQTGEMEYLSPQMLTTRTVTFPNMLKSGKSHVLAFQNGKLKRVRRRDVQYVLPYFEKQFAPITSLVPLKSAMKQQRTAMAQRMLTQALPILNAEAPLVQSALADEPNKSYEEHYAHFLGAVRAPREGTVIEASPGLIRIQHPDGTQSEQTLATHYPYPRKTYLHQTPAVRPGQSVRPGDLLATSNFTDAKGVTAMGLNARVAYIPDRGHNFEDAISISEGFANRAKSLHMYQHQVEKNDELHVGRNKFISLFATKYPTKVIKNIDENGVVRPGTIVHEGDPLVLAVRHKPVSMNSLHGGRSSSFVDASETWEHSTPGVVTDISDTDKGISVLVKTEMPMQVGDKMCYDTATRLHVRGRGYVFIHTITLNDEVATTNPVTGALEWQKPIAYYRYPHHGEMYSLQTGHLDMLVTLEHRLWARPEDGEYRAISAAELLATGEQQWYFRGTQETDPQEYPRHTRYTQEMLKPYDGYVYCVTVPNHILHVERNGKTYLSCNSGRYGDKGVIARILPEHDMPKDDAGRPYEVLINPLGIISRANPAQVIETVLGKIAEKRGERYAIPDFQDIADLRQYADDESVKHGVKAYDSIYDPQLGEIKNVLTGNRFMMKLHHTSESKVQGRNTGSYTAEGLPAKGGATGAKRISLLDSTALLSHNATGVISDAHAVRGQRNVDYWRQVMSGYDPPPPPVPVTYQKYVNSLKASGINIVKDGPRLHFMALTNKDVDEHAGDRDLENAETVDWRDRLNPVKGGLFDDGLTGGHSGTRWSAIKLHVPLPSPVFEDPICRLLNITHPMFEAIISGEKPLKGKTGTQAISDALKAIDVDAEIAKARGEIASGKKTYRDAAIKRLSYLKNAKRLGIHPSDWVLNRVPVLPPLFRPVSVMGNKKLPMVSDINYLYKEVFDANQALKQLADKTSDTGEEQLALYKSFKAVTGLGEPQQPKNQERKVTGLIKQIIGNSPKYSTVQFKLIGTTTDMVGRGAVVPDADLDLDEVGIPEKQAWAVYRPFVIRRLVRAGLPPLHAAREFMQQTEAAKQALATEIKERPVIVNRAPVLHRYGIMAFWPRLVKDSAIHTNTLINVGFNLDHDGDAMQFHVPASKDAVRDAIEKMLPSRNLFATGTFKVHQLPGKEYVGGLYTATAAIDHSKPPLRFESVADVIRAHQRGEIGVDRRVQVLGDH